MSSEYRAGFVTIVGRPNTGKSTLINSLMNNKVVITSHHPNTTRNPIRAVLTRKDYQIVLVDTPGVHKPKTILGTRLNNMVEDSASDGDVVVLTLPADEEIGKGDEFIVKKFVSPRSRLIIALTKMDLVSPAKHMEQLQAISEFVARLNVTAHEIFPLSAKDKESIIRFESVLAHHLPTSHPLYPAETTLDQALELTFSEFIREAAIADLRQELPHSIMVTIDEYSKRGEKNFYDIHATIHVERDSQKGILLGDKGSRLKSIGTGARGSIENFLEAKVFLGLHVKVSKEWQKDPKALARFGFSEKN
jgi:GTP-binding protein Era